MEARMILKAKSKVMRHAGAAITTTTITDLLAFVISNFLSKFPLVRFSSGQVKFGRWLSLTCSCAGISVSSQFQAWRSPISSCAPSSSPPSLLTRAGSMRAGKISYADVQSDNFKRPGIFNRTTGTGSAAAYELTRKARKAAVASHHTGSQQSSAPDPIWKSQAHVAVPLFLLSPPGSTHLYLACEVLKNERVLCFATLISQAGHHGSHPCAPGDRHLWFHSA